MGLNFRKGDKIIPTVACAMLWAFKEMFLYLCTTDNQKIRCL